MDVVSSKGEVIDRMLNSAKLQYHVSIEPLEIFHASVLDVIRRQHPYLIHGMSTGIEHFYQHIHDLFIEFGFLVKDKYAFGKVAFDNQWLGCKVSLIGFRCSCLKSLRVLDILFFNRRFFW